MHHAATRLVRESRRFREFYSIVHGYRDRETGITKTKTIKSLGYLDELEKQYPDPIAHFREVARQMTEEEKARRKVVVTLDKDEEFPVATDLCRNIGYTAVLRIYHELELQQFFNNAARNRDFQFNTSSIMALLVISRILSPGSKRKPLKRSIAFDKKTGEVLQSGQAVSLDVDKINEEERFDGYYAIVTSEAEMSEAEVIDTYRGLWEIEETFRISKGTLETRPTYVSREESIQAHFLSCFISLLILRLLQKQTEY